MKYFWATIRHKWFVLLASFRTGLPLWLALMHDLSKFSQAELVHYNRQFFGDKSDPEGFALAWLHHYHCNDHHWEYWIVESIHSHTNPTRDGCIVDNCLSMSDLAITHMITDWLGAGRSYDSSWDISEWIGEHLSKMKMHFETRERVLSELKRLNIIERKV